MPHLPLLPIGQQDFSQLRTKNLLYVDKTKYIYELWAKQIPFFFLSRPRRFGKSLLVSTLKELFSGNKNLFEGLYIYDKIEWENHPIIHIDCSQLDFQLLGLQQALQKRLRSIAEEYRIMLKEETLGLLFTELIKRLYQLTGKQVVVLIDEYDKPITDVLELGNSAEAYKNRQVLRIFYSGVKGNSAYLRFFFLTGISRFTKVSLFSDLNNLVDLSFDNQFHNLLGYTQSEIETYFSQHIEHIAQKEGISRENILEKIRHWYNGYSWNGKEKLYNPFSILRFLDTGSFMNFWFESGTPKLLVNLLKKDLTYNLQNLKSNLSLINNFDIESLNSETLLFQTGYLTIAEIDQFDRYILNYPNKEVEQSLLQYLLADYSCSLRSVNLAYDVVTALEKNDIAFLCQTLNTIFASIPYQIFQSNSERYFHSIVFIVLRLCGFYIESEVSVSTGRIDAVLVDSKGIYIFEFKLDESPEIAIEQIKDKNYLEKYFSHNKDIFLVGIQFSSASKKIEKWTIEKGIR